MNKNYKSAKGITLVALVITIIVLLILAGISISALSGENGILGKASEAKTKTEIADIKEQIQTDIIGEQAGNTGDISDSALKTILQKYGTINYETDGTTIKSITTTKGNYEIAMADIWDGTTYNPPLVADGSWDGKVNMPKLASGMTGIYWNESGEEVEVTSSNKDKWYDYSTTANQSKWANAKTKDGSYWVWIPRYEYKISGTTVNVKFIETSKTTVDSDYTYIHPSFRDGSSTNYMNGEWNSELPGFWVAKYAAGFQQSTTDSSGNVINGTDTVKYSDKKYTSYNSIYTTNALGQTLTSAGNPNISYPVFKPLTYAYNVISTGDSYTIAQEIDSATDFYGLSSADSHLMKNSEWGAVAYLTQSSYGRNGTEVTINSKNLSNLSSKNIYAVTGYEGSSTANGVGASSTNNKTGVFDLNGCVWERVAAYITNGNSNLATYGSSYVAKTDKDGEAYKTLSTRYATVYPFNTTSDSYANNWTTYNGLKTDIYGYGDAVLETSSRGDGSYSWNSDYSYFPNAGLPFFVRGGPYNYGTGAGAFAFYNADGGPYSSSGFRVCLAV